MPLEHLYWLKLSSLNLMEAAKAKDHTFLKLTGKIYQL